MGFGDAAQAGWKKYTVFEGRAPRSEYWFWTLSIILLTVAGFVVWGILDVFLPGIVAHAIGGLALVLWSLAIILPSLGMAVRRLHDMNVSGWWYLLALVPYLGGLIFFVWFCFKGTDGDNRYGPDPLQPHAVDAFN